MRIPYLSLVILLFLFLFGCTSNDEDEPESKKPKLTTTKSTYQDVDIMSEFYYEPQIKYTVHYPSYKNHQTMTIISDYIHELTTDFLNQAEQLQSKKEFHELHATFHFEYHSNEYSSLVFNIKKSLGEHQEQYMKTFLIDLRSEKELTLQNIFLKEEDYKKILKLDSSTEIKNFTVNKDGLTLYLQNDSITYFSWKELAKHLDSSFAFKPEMPEEEPIIVDNHRLKNNIMPRQKRKVKEEKNLKMIAITFDDGPHSTITPRILDMLKKYDAKATFFMVGERVPYYPNIVKRVAEEGHEIANHTWSHPSLTSLSVEGILKELNKTDEAIEAITGIPVTLIRPPYGAYNETVQKHATGPLINWLVDTLDWKNRNADTIMKTIEGKIDTGSIILMHDLYESTAIAAERIVKKYTELGYTFVTVSELLGFTNAQPVNGKVYTRKE